MRNTRLLAIGALSFALWGVSTSAAFAEDPVPADPPPAVEPAPEPPPVEPPADPAPPVTPSPEPTHVETPDEYSLRTTGYTLAENAAMAQGRAEEIAAFNAWNDRYFQAMHNYVWSAPGRSLNYDSFTGVWTDENGAVFDISAWDVGYFMDDYTGAKGYNGETFGDSGLYGVTDDASLAELEEIADDNFPLISPFTDPATAPSIPDLEIAPAPPATDDSGTATIAFAAWVSATAYALWRRRYRALDLLNKARAARP